jgi:hypothetical protein
MMDLSLHSGYDFMSWRLNSYAQGLYLSFAFKRNVNVVEHGLASTSTKLLNLHAGR